MEKKPYVAPLVTKVSLDIMNSVLAVCRSSTVADPLEDCRVTQACAFI